MIDRLIDVVASRSKLISFFLTGIGIVLAIFYWLQLARMIGNPADAHAYWAADPNNLYPPTDSPIHRDAYLYSPAFEIVIGWARNLSFETFVAVWRALLLVALVWLAGPFTMFVLLTVAVASEINAGNIQLLLAVAMVLGFRGMREGGDAGGGAGGAGKTSWWPATWAFVVLTKVTPGVGLLWFALRRQWRSLAIALAVTAVITAVTYLIWPDRWMGWITLLIDGGSPPPLFPYYLPFLPRFLVAIAVVVIGAWRGWRWSVIVAGTLALPAFYFISPSMLVGVLPFAREALGRWAERRRDATDAHSPA